MSEEIKLSKTQLQTVNSWLKNLGGKDIAWIANNDTKVAEYIEKKYTNLNTKKTYYNTLVKVLHKQGKNEKAKKYSDIGTKYNQKSVEESKDQKVSKARLEHYVTWGHIMKKRKELKQEVKENADNYNVNLQYLFVSLYTYQPPLRFADYTTMHITKTEPPEDKKNYLWISGNKLTIVLNKDKVSFSKGRGEIPIESEELKQIIKKSLEKFPRKYLFTKISDKNTAIGEKGTLNFRNNVIYKIFPGKNVGTDIYRSAYISNFLDNKKMDESGAIEKHTNKDKENLAVKMRTSVDQMQNTYHKFAEDNKKEETKEEATEDSDSETETDESDEETETDEEDEKKVPQKKKPFNRKEYMKKYREIKKKEIAQYKKEYYEEHPEKVLRPKIIWELNTGNVKQPKPETVTKYNLKFDKKTKKWK